jgi:multidrug resistance efflux pump
VEEAKEKLAAARKELKEPVNQQFLIRKQELILERNRQKVEEAKEKLATAQQKLQQLEVLAQKGFHSGNELQEQKEQVRNAEFARARRSNRSSTQIFSNFSAFKPRNNAPLNSKTR